MRQCLGAVLLLGLAVGVACVAYAVAPTAVILGSWTGAGLWLWWGVSRKIDNPSPPPPEDPPENENTQVRTIEQDPDNPHRHRVVWAEKE